MIRAAVYKWYMVVSVLQYNSEKPLVPGVFVYYPCDKSLSLAQRYSGMSHRPSHSIISSEPFSCNNTTMVYRS